MRSRIGFTTVLLLTLLGSVPGAVAQIYQLSASDGSPPDAVQVNADGLVGIGTTTPVSRLHLARDWDGEEGALRVSGDKPTLRMTGGPLAGNESWLMHLGSDGPGALQFFRRSPSNTWVNHLTILPSGNVGLGGTPHSTAKFQILSGNDSYVSVDAMFGDLRVNGGTDGLWGIYNDSTLPTARTEIIMGSEPRLAVTANGDVGIGTIAPAAKLDVNGTTRTKVLEIVGADVAEKFPTSDKVERGMVVAIDPPNPGKLCLARGAYNRRVAGVVSGANDFPVGAVLGNRPGHEDAPPIALSGSVYVWCDAVSGSIESGDLLTTSDTPGHAMKVRDLARAQGAILGKAMTRLESGKGLVLVLVTLQ